MLPDNIAPVVGGGCPAGSVARMLPLSTVLAIRVKRQAILPHSHQLPGERVTEEVSWANALHLRSCLAMSCLAMSCQWIDDFGRSNLSPSPLDFVLGGRWLKTTKVLSSSPGCVSGLSTHLGSIRDCPGRCFSAASVLRWATGSSTWSKWGLGMIAKATSSIATWN